MAKYSGNIFRPVDLRILTVMVAGIAVFGVVDGGAASYGARFSFSGHSPPSLLARRSSSPLHVSAVACL
jgi:hypothetical protein